MTQMTNTPFDFELHSAPGSLGTKIWQEGRVAQEDYSLQSQRLLQQEGARWDSEWQAWWLAGDASRDPLGQQTRMERAESLVSSLNALPRA